MQVVYVVHKKVQRGEGEGEQHAGAEGDGTLQADPEGRGCLETAHERLHVQDGG